MEELFAKMTASDAAEFMGIQIQNVHKKIKAKNLESHKSLNRVYFGFETARELFGMNFDKKIISFQIVKGGTGKTSLAFSFALRANLYGARVLCIDLDQQGNLTHAFGVDANQAPVMIDVIKGAARLEEGIINISPGLDLFASRIENAVLDNALLLDSGRYPLNNLYQNILQPVLDNYDFIIFDCPPALGSSVAAATLASDYIIVPVTPEQFGLSGLKITYDEVQVLNKSYNKKAEIKIVLNKFDSRTALSSEVLGTLFNDPVFSKIKCESVIRVNQEFPNTIFNGTNIYNSLKNSSAKEDIDFVVREILGLSEAYKTRTNKIDDNKTDEISE